MPGRLGLPGGRHFPGGAVAGRGARREAVASLGAVSSTQTFADHLARALGVAIGELSPVGGGDVAQSYRVRTDDGRTLFAKTHADPPPRFFTSEGEGLRWLAQAKALPVPEVVAMADEPVGYLVLEWVAQGRRGSARAEADFGRGLARLHRAGAPCFGRTDGTGHGSLGLPNDPFERWADFYAQDRLLPLAAIARRRGSLPERDCAALERLAGELGGLGVPDEPPARLHGDLWAGNRLVDSDGASWLIDPSAHGGHREYDLAMMALFGGFGEEAFAAYDAEHPLGRGWPERVALHQVAPLVVHAIKFGGGYAGSAARAIHSYL